jgi:hypothetical protein
MRPINSSTAVRNRVKLVRLEMKQIDLIGKMIRRIGGNFTD